MLASGAPGSKVRIRARHGVYRAFVESADQRFWTISAPLQRNAHVPLQAGEPVILEVPSQAGVYLYRTVVMDREMDGRRIRLQTPHATRPIDRREQRRDNRVAGTRAFLDDHGAAIFDLSEDGICLASEVELDRGTRVKVLSPGLGLERMGWVLDSTADVLDGRQARRYRIRFE